MIDLIPIQFRMLALAIALVAAAAAGATVNGWRLDGDHQRELTAAADRYEQLAEKVREQNRAVTAMKAASDAADGRRQIAEDYANAVLGRIANRDAGVANSKQPDCNGVLREAWGNWK